MYLVIVCEIDHLLPLPINVEMSVFTLPGNHRCKPRLPDQRGEGSLAEPEDGHDQTEEQSSQ